ncbi:helix-turn-helix domain-containing protein [Ruegeria sp. 6PALISEP08]|uniref:helix-turn-helix domain-containing protein n=1 Tax=Ruegeria sp. 6PALISEP08 TaxID=1225660 RepID=UPI00067E6A0C|nr:helix-turn-helix domain-containing protein [Ruegeria sp. 6PALISEP08]
MKHYVVANDHAHLAETSAPVSDRVQCIDVILHCNSDKASAELVVEFYQALNSLVDRHTYVVNFRVPGNDSVGGPLFWAGRTAIFWGDIENAWTPTAAERSWVNQVLNLSPRSILVGGSVMLLSQISGSDRTIAAVHSAFEAAAVERGINSSGTSTYFSSDGRTHSANTRISALRLLADFVSMDHGEHLADTLRRYIGLSEPQRMSESQVANRLIRKANGDRLVTLAVHTMLENIEDPLRISDLSDVIGTSTRQLQRRFLCKTGATLLETYKELRLERSNSLLKFTDMPLVEIASATGFSSRTAMSRAFFKHYKSRPEQVRNERFLGHVPG